MAAVLATVTHHSYSKFCTANAALRGQKIGTSTGVGPAGCFELSSDDGRPTAGMRPASMLEPWPQGKGERHSGIGYELVQALDAPVLQMVEQLPNILQFFVHESAWSTPWLWVRPCDPAATSVSSWVLSRPSLCNDRCRGMGYG